MALIKLEVNIEKTDLYAPFSGLCLAGERMMDDLEILQSDPTLLFTHCINYDYLSPRVQQQLNDLGVTDIEELSPEALSQALDFKNGILIEAVPFDGEVAFYGFAPQEK